MNLQTKYLGLTLKNPFVVGASPFCDNLTACRELEDAGAAAIVMHSFFEEQIEAENRALVHHLDTGTDSYSEASSFFPSYEDYHLGPNQYLRQLTRLRSLVDIPVIASLNGCHLGNWVGYAQQMEDAGAAAIELNLYQLPTDATVPADEVEAAMIEIVRTVTTAVRIPVAVKISPFHTSLPQFAATLVASGAAGLVLFNRFYQPDIDIRELEVIPQLKLSDSSELLLRLRWLSILSPELGADLACSGGVHSAEDAIKALLAGAQVVQVVSALLRHGPNHLRVLRTGLVQWMDEMEYDRVDRLRGAMNLSRCPDPAAHERANYLKILQSWRV
ncbi:dihydroorotate dehydrogenase-like protein [Synoicihabitans lomoniglobus]|uniref:Dihydroorotate dehydrogenase-like protein n=1 Tax=Synoicihabitans lomoniglobus TaxID=2909285 RepID=A0AAE9ZZ85_9BACT|nr:dihydroorotate dehydrogenase-like protein [Opitutaceae bacterium LMO-M01]WED65483.1 dihydroorotate dehydrogenase-like protein [Opitutaceae bacterium LMO-M01]